MTTLTELQRAINSIDASGMAAVLNQLPRGVYEQFVEAVNYAARGDAPNEVFELFECQPDEKGIEDYDRFIYAGYTADDEPVRLVFNRMQLDRKRNHHGHELLAYLPSGDREEVALPDFIDNLTMEQFDAVVLAFIEQAKVVPCPCCGKPKWGRGSGRLSKLSDSKEPYANYCHPCTMKWFDDYSERQAAAAKVDDIRFKAQGYTHKIDFCVHPVSGGDDYFACAYSKGVPTKRQIANLLRGSRVKNDYKVSLL